MIKWWEYLNWRNMRNSLKFYANLEEEAKTFVRGNLGCDDCYGWAPDVCGENCPHDSRGKAK